ncbi:MAG TPA: DHHA1 domain-containing protein [Methanocorpusculum sp.]|nr:DHHA1 domain-containing protein [Methanocorpusculum sp.]
MSLEETAEKIAARIKEMDYVEVYSHNDADGVCAAAIITIALKRADISFKLKMLNLLSFEDVANPDVSILCDIGGSIKEFPDTTIIIDHHVPYNKSPYHLNPRLCGVDGESEMTASAAAYLVANKLGDNRDLAGLVLVSVIGDMQKIAGPNAEIVNEAIGNNIINTKRAILLPGRNTREQLMIASSPYFAKVSGSLDTASAIEQDCMSKVSDEDFNTQLLSEIVLRSDAAYPDFMNLYGDSWILEREVITDAYSLEAVIDACGKAGRTDLAYAAAVGDAAHIKEAWDTAAEFRTGIIDACATARNVAKNAWMVDSLDAVSDVADVFAKSKQTPVFVLARTPEFLKVSARAPFGAQVNFEEFFKEVNASLGGTGGGHALRAGAELPPACEGEFLAMLEGFA